MSKNSPFAGAKGGFSSVCYGILLLRALQSQADAFAGGGQGGKIHRAADENQAAGGINAGNGHPLNLCKRIAQAAFRFLRPAAGKIEPHGIRRQIQGLFLPIAAQKEHQRAQAAGRSRFPWALPKAHRR